MPNLCCLLLVEYYFCEDAFTFFSYTAHDAFKMKGPLSCKIYEDLECCLYEDPSSIIFIKEKEFGPFLNLFTGCLVSSMVSISNIVHQDSMERSLGFFCSSDFGKERWQFATL